MKKIGIIFLITMATFCDICWLLILITTHSKDNPLLWYITIIIFTYICMYFSFEALFGYRRYVHTQKILKYSYTRVEGKGLIDYNKFWNYYYFKKTIN